MGMLLWMPTIMISRTKRRFAGRIIEHGCPFPACTPFGALKLKKRNGEGWGQTPGQAGAIPPTITLYARHRSKRGGALVRRRMMFAMSPRQQQTATTDGSSVMTACGEQT